MVFTEIIKWINYGFRMVILILIMRLLNQFTQTCTQAQRNRYIEICTKVYLLEVSLEFSEIRQMPLHFSMGKGLSLEKQENRPRAHHQLLATVPLVLQTWELTSSERHPTLREMLFAAHCSLRELKGLT